ncbi:MAG: oligosaccharide flippase family protein [Parvibaculaceae bacterium]
MKKAVKSGSVLLLANLAEVAFPFIRNILLARLLSQENFGVAVSLAMIVALVEIGFDFGIPVSAVRYTATDNPKKALATLHTLQLTRAVMVGALIMAMSPLLAIIFKSPHATSAYVVVGACAMLRGFGNLGVKQAMRDYVYWPNAITLIMIQLAWTLTVIVAAWISPDYWAMVWGLVASIIASVTTSNMLSRFPWRLSWDKAIADEATAFGKPLVPNGFVSGALSLGDRVFIGWALGVHALAFYSVIFGTATLPRGAIVRFLTNVFVPAFVNRPPDHPSVKKNCARWTLVLSLIAFLYAMGFIFVGRPLLPLLFGPAYAATPYLMSLVGLNLFVKFLYQLPSPVAMAQGNSKLMLTCTVYSIIALGVGAAAAMIVPSIDVFVLALTAAEVIAVLRIGMIAVARLDYPPGQVAMALLGPMAAIGIALAVSLAFPVLPLLDWLLLGGALTLGGLIFYAFMTHIFVEPLKPLLRQAVSGFLNRKAVVAGEEQ